MPALHVSTTLRALPVRAITAAIADAAERWCDADFPLRVRATRALEERTGYSEPVIDYALDRLFESLARDAIEQTIVSELGALDVLDGFAMIGGRRRMALGLERVAVISSRTTIGVAIVPAIFALCAKSSVMVKDRTDTLVGAFFDTLAAERHEFAQAAQATVWDGGHGALEEALLGRADAVVAFGADATLAAIRARLAGGARFIGYGGKVSAAYFAREALDAETNVRGIARAAANDLVLYDTEGCLSLHMVFVEEGGTVDPQRFTEIFAEAVAAAATEFPPGSAIEGAKGAIAALRDRARFAAAGDEMTLHVAPDLAWLVALDRRRAWPPPFLPRTCVLLPVDEPSQALAYLRAHRLPLEGLALEPADARDDVLTFSMETGAAQVRPAGTLQRPPVGLRHGGRARIAEFVRWIDATTQEQ